MLDGSESPALSSKAWKPADNWKQSIMNNLPGSVHIHEEGPREGFQYERNPIPTARKVELIDALSLSGIRHIQVASFVSPKAVPGMADAEAIVAGLNMQPDVEYTGLWLNEQGLERAIATGRLHIRGSLSLNASTAFLRKNQNKTPEEQFALQQRFARTYGQRGIALERASIMAAFGCNYEGDIPTERVVGLVGQLVEIATEEGLTIPKLSLADTMAWATPLAIKKTLTAVRSKFPDIELSLHLHDTRGLGIANAYAGMEMGIRHFDSSVAGLGGCPFAGHAGAAGNVCTEDLVFMCAEMGIETGIVLDTLIECAKLAETIVGHPLPGSIMRGGTLAKLRQRLGSKA